jgi:hypothetical protein
VIKNEDPGGFPCSIIENSVFNNINRQIVSTREGLKSSHREYCIKMRTDFILTSNNFLLYWKKYDAKDYRFFFFKERIITCTIYSRNPRYNSNNFRLPFHPSDFFFFGLREDLITLFSLDLIYNDKDKKYFAMYPQKQKETYSKIELSRFVPEQFLWIGFIKKYICINCNHREHITSENIELTEKTFANNLILLEKEKLGIESLKANLFNQADPENCFSFDEWFACYLKYCHNDNRLFRKYLKDVRDKNSLLKIKFLKTKIRGFFRCWKENGLLYTVKHLVKKCLRKTGVIK